MLFKSYSIPVFFVFVFLVSSCTKMPIYKSTSYNKTTNREIVSPLTANFDEKNSISYGVANDDTHLYLQAIFLNRESLMKIMRGGLNIYFDSEGKKKKDYHLKIEKAEAQLSEYELMVRQGSRDISNQQKNMATTIDMMYNKITWNKNGDRFIFYRNLQLEPIAVKLGPNKQNELMLEIKIPLAELPLSDSQNLFSIGIETGSVSSGNMSAQRQSAGMSGGRSGGGRGGRGGGGGGKSGGGGMSGGKSGGSRPMTQPSGVSPIKIWFQVQL